MEINEGSPEEDERTQEPEQYEHMLIQEEPLSEELASYENPQPKDLNSYEEQK
jgi:hypothetical protein